MTLHCERTNIATPARSSKLYEAPVPMEGSRSRSKSGRHRNAIVRFGGNGPFNLGTQVLGPGLPGSSRGRKSAKETETPSALSG